MRLSTILQISVAVLYVTRFRRLAIDNYDIETSVDGHNNNIIIIIKSPVYKIPLVLPQSAPAKHQK